jgi:hypothetical protein
MLPMGLERANGSEPSSSPRDSVYDDFDDDMAFHYATFRKGDTELYEKMSEAAVLKGCHFSMAYDDSCFSEEFWKRGIDDDLEEQGWTLGKEIDEDLSMFTFKLKFRRVVLCSKNESERCTLVLYFANDKEVVPDKIHIYHGHETAPDFPDDLSGEDSSDSD